MYAPERKKNSAIKIIRPKARDICDMGDFWNLYDKIVVGIAKIMKVLTKNTCSDPVFSLNIPTKAKPKPVIANKTKKIRFDDERQKKKAEAKLSRPSMNKEELKSQAAGPPPKNIRGFDRL